MYQLAIFDLDGTLLDTLADLRQGLNYALATQGFAPRTLPEVRAFVGNGIRKLIMRAVPAGTDEAQIDAVFAAFNPYYAVHCADFTKPYPGIPEGVRKKPCPDSVFEVVRQLGAEALRAVYIGDSEVDIETAKNAGMPCISVSWGFRDRDVLVGAGAGSICDDTDALYRALREG